MNDLSAQIVGGSMYVAFKIHHCCGRLTSNLARPVRRCLPPAPELWGWDGLHLPRLALRRGGRHSLRRALSLRLSSGST